MYKYQYFQCFSKFTKGIFILKKSNFTQKHLNLLVKSAIKALFL